MPTTNSLLKKIPAPHGDIVGSCFSTQPWSQFVQGDPEKEFMGLPKMWFREIRPSLGEEKKISQVWNYW